jgi:hypothetical protein
MNTRLDIKKSNLTDTEDNEDKPPSHRWHSSEEEDKPPSCPQHVRLKRDFGLTKLFLLLYRLFFPLNLNSDFFAAIPQPFNFKSTYRPATKAQTYTSPFFKGRNTSRIKSIRTMIL